MFVNMISKGGKGDDKLTDEETTELTAVQASAYLNMSVCYFMMKEYKRSIDKATASINL